MTLHTPVRMYLQLLLLSFILFTSIIPIEISDNCGAYGTGYPRSIDFTFVNANLTTNTTWFKHASPYYIENNVWITNGSYLNIEPADLEIRIFGDAALATFHLVGNDKRLGRRTFVLALIDDAWKIVHLHASNVYGARP